MKNLSKKQKIISGVLFVGLLIGFIFVGTRDYKTKEPDQHEIFSNEYKIVPTNNVFVYSNSTKISNILKNGTGIIFFGFNKNEYSGYYAKLLNEVATQKNIKEIAYYDFYEDRKNLNGTYQNIVLLLGNYLQKDDLGKVNLVAPSMVIVKDGKILYYDDETSFVPALINAEDYWTDYNIGLKKASLSYMIDEYLMEETNGE